MLIKQTKEMTEAERLAAQNSNNQFLQALAYSAVGTIFPYAGESAPDTFMLCDGSELNVAEYPELFSVIGYKFGGSDDIFKLPDLKGRTLVGVDGSDEKFNTVGKSGGETSHTLTIDEMPSHNHDFIRNDGRRSTYGWGHGEAHTGALAEVATVDTGNNYVITQTGNGQPHNNMPPFTVINYIIKVVQSIPEIKMRLPVDQTYSPESENAQSGKAVAQAFALKDFEFLKDITLTEDVKSVSISTTDTGEALSKYKDFFIYFLGKCTVDESSKPLQLRANKGELYFMYKAFNKATTVKGFWVMVETVLKTDEPAFWSAYPNSGFKVYKTTYPAEFLGDVIEGRFATQGLSANNRQVCSDLTINGRGYQIKSLHIDHSGASEALFATGSRFLLFGRKA